MILKILDFHNPIALCLKYMLKVANIKSKPMVYIFVDLED
jgi:hypothetical protein